MIEKGIVSIIIPVYNGENVITQTTEYILSSTYKSLEVILINDGSTDGSLAVCKQLEQMDNRIKVYTKANGGVAEARNYGVEKATGDYLCFCDQDDTVESEMYQHMVEKIEADMSDICMCSTGRSIDGKKSLFEVSEDSCYQGEGILEHLLYPILFNGYDVPIAKSNRRRYPHIWNCMFRKEFWDKYQFRFRSYVNYEDDLLMKIDALSRAKCVSTVSYVGYYWNVNLKSETYRHKYIEELAVKQQMCYEDMEQSVRRCIKDEKIVAMFKQVTFCKQYLEAIHILTSPYKKKSYSAIKDFYRETVYERDFEECITARKYVSKGQVKANLLLPILNYRLTGGCYILEKVLDYILWLSLHSQVLTKFERRLKK